MAISHNLCVQKTVDQIKKYIKETLLPDCYTTAIDASNAIYTKQQLRAKVLLYLTVASH